MKLLKMGDPRNLETDVGPVIDISSKSEIDSYKQSLQNKINLIGETPFSEELGDGCFVAPIAIEISHVSDVRDEVFGPVLHVMKFSASGLDELVDDINLLGYGLTMGLHTRLDSRVDRISKRAKVGNLYVNRSQIGAVVGVQPFGGEGLSGTGPKAGGPNYLLQFSKSTIGETVQNKSAASADVIKLSPPERSGEVESVLIAARRAQHEWNQKFDYEQRLPIIKAAFENSCELQLCLGPH